MILTRVPRAFAALSIACFLCGFSFLGLGGSSEKNAKEPDGPRLVLFLVVDGLSEKTFADNAYAYGEGGFLFLMQNAAWFENARHGHAVTLTSPGHATVVTGTDPLRHGVVGNRWIDRKTGAAVYSGDLKRGPVMAVPTLGDVLSESTGGRSRSFAVSGKDRGAIVSAGKRGVAYYWNGASGRFERWPAGRSSWKFDVKRGEASEDALVFDFAEELVSAEKLGAGSSPDTLVLSLSTLDLLGHRFGPGSEEVRRHLVDLDGRLESFLGFLHQRVGLENTLIVLTSDHGFGDTEPVGTGAMRAALDARLTSAFGKTGLVLGVEAPWVYLDAAAVKAAKLDMRKVEAEAKKILESHPGVASAFTRAEAFEGGTPFAKAAGRSWGPAAGDLYVVPDEGKYFAPESETAKAGHGSPYGRDTDVPILFFGAPFIDGLYDEPVETVDIVPTLAAALGLKMPPVDGRPLTEIFEKAARS